MNGTQNNIVISSLLGGLTPAIVAPLSWPIVIFIVENRWPDLGHYLFAVLSISFLAGLGGVIGSLLIGAPILLILTALKANKPILVGLLGAIVGFIVFLVFGPVLDHAPLSRSWPLFVFFSLMGASCGISSSYLSSPNLRLNSDR